MLAEKNEYLQEIAQKDDLLQKTITQKDALLHKATAETERLRALLRQHGIDDSE